MPVNLVPGPTKKYDWSDIIMFKAIRTLKLIVQQKFAQAVGLGAEFAINPVDYLNQNIDKSDLPNLPVQGDAPPLTKFLSPECNNSDKVIQLLTNENNFTLSKYDNEYGWQLLDKCKYQELLKCFYNNKDYTSLLTLNNYLDQILTDFIIEYRRIYFKFGTTDYRIRNEFNLWKLKMIDGFYQFKIFFQLRLLLKFYSNPNNNLTNKAKERIQIMYIELENRQWCNNILNDDERSILINKIGANPEEFIYTPLLSDDDLKQCSDSCQLELSDDDLLVIEQKQEVIDLLTQSFDKLELSNLKRKAVEDPEN